MERAKEIVGDAKIHKKSRHDEEQTPSNTTHTVVTSSDGYQADTHVMLSDTENNNCLPKLSGTSPRWHRRGQPDSSLHEAAVDAPLEKIATLLQSHCLLSSQSGVIATMDNARKHKYVTGTNSLPSSVYIFYLFFCINAVYVHIISGQMPFILPPYLIIQFLFTTMPDKGEAIFNGPVFASPLPFKPTLRSSGPFNGQSECVALVYTVLQLG